MFILAAKITLLMAFRYFFIIYFYICAIADEVSKVHAICVKCGQLASFSHRTVKNDKQVLLGETAEYEPLCRECYLRAIKGDRTAAGG